MFVWLISVLAVGLVLGLSGCWWRQRRVRAARSAAPLSAAERQCLLDRIPQAGWLAAEQHERWFAQVQRFRHGRRWRACGGHRLTTDQRLLIAGLACLLRLQPQAEHQPLFAGIREVLVYPEVFRVPPASEPFDEGLDQGLTLVDDEPDERIGEQGPGQVVLSWADVEAALAGDSVNVVIHEFAHALDEENPAGEGAPPMPPELAADWAQVMGTEYARLRRHRRPPVLDKYGAQSPGEFFGVVSETYFQQPVALYRHHPALYELLARYFQLRPPTTS